MVTFKKSALSRHLTQAIDALNQTEIFDDGKKQGKLDWLQLAFDTGHYSQFLWMAEALTDENITRPNRESIMAETLNRFGKATPKKPPLPASTFAMQIEIRLPEITNRQNLMTGIAELCFVACAVTKGQIEAPEVKRR